MSIAEYALKNRVISWISIVVLVVGGTSSFLGLSQLEFPQFPIPQALVNTSYPGASPLQVEEEVTLPIERAMAELEYVRDVESFTSAGLSQITVVLHETFQADQQPQIWDELRRKVGDIQGQLPPGAGTSRVIDDFSDVYGILYNITSDEFSYRELQNYAEYLQRELLSVKGVKKVSLAGLVAEQVVIEISQQNMNALNIDPAWIKQIIQKQSDVSNAGEIVVQGQSVRIHPTGEFGSLTELESLVVSQPSSQNLIRLGDIAEISRRLDETPRTLYRSNGKKAVSLGVSFSKSVNVVDVSELVAARMDSLEFARPIGVTIGKVYDQGKVVEKSVSEFLVSLAEAVVIVIVVLLLAMGLRSGILMGGVLLLTILGTFIGMSILNIEIQIISLGALIIALGMLVDNAIVITEGVLVGLKRGQTKRESIIASAKQAQWPLLGATLIGIIAFAPVGLSADAVGDFLGSLFQVLCIALLLSWVIALTLTPFFCEIMFKEEISNGDGATSDPYKGFVFVTYRTLLSLALKYRTVTVGITLGLLVAAVAGFGHVKQQFFPPSNTPIFYIDVWMQQGTDVRETEKHVTQLEQAVITYPEVKNVTAVIGSGAQRFILTYAPEKSYSSYGQLIVEVGDLETIQRLIPLIRQDFESRFPQTNFKFKLMDQGPSPAAKIEARFYGSEPDVLRSLSAQAIAVMDEQPSAIAVRHSWREKTNVIRPWFNDAAARISGVSKQDLDRSLLSISRGEIIGLYRDGSHLLPLVMRAPDAERNNVDSIQELQIWSGERNGYIPLENVVPSIDARTEDSLIVRRNFKRVISVMADVAPFSNETSESVRKLIAEKVEAIDLPDGYSLEWGGELEAQTRARKNLMKSLPIGFITMILITIFLFNTIRQPLAIWLTVPLALIGVSVGLLLLDMPFSFTALLGLLSLSGMIAKNGIVLVEQINIQESEGDSLQDAILNACVSRVRPVCMAAITTMLGMIPLLYDAFFQSMAVTIIFGLGFATILTLIVLPAFYSLLYNVKYP